MAYTLFAKSSTRDAISQPMLADLCQQTGCSGTLSRMGLGQSDFDYLAAKRSVRADRIRICFAGTIQVENTFELFVQALATARKELTVPLALEFFGADAYQARHWFDPSWMVARGNLPESDFRRELRDCTWGFAPMSVSDDDPRYNRFSLPIKIVSYLAAGLPVLTLGHPGSTIVQLASNYRFGVCSTGQQPDHLAKELLRALAIPDPWDRFGPEIVRCARAEFDAPRMREVLYQCFSKCAGRV
jgi:hypothetical protein